MEEKREGKTAFSRIDMSSYNQKVFGMFTGEERQVKMRFRNHLAGAVFDRFGPETMLIPDGEEHFTFTVKLAVSPQFHAWLFGFGTEAEILTPEDVREEAGRAAREIAEMYAAAEPLQS